MPSATCFLLELQTLEVLNYLLAVLISGDGENALHWMRRTGSLMVATRAIPWSRLVTVGLETASALIEILRA